MLPQTHFVSLQETFLKSSMVHIEHWNIWNQVSGKASVRRRKDAVVAGRKEGVWKRTIEIYVRRAE